MPSVGAYDTIQRLPSARVARVARVGASAKNDFEADADFDDIWFLRHNTHDLLPRTLAQGA